MKDHLGNSDGVWTPSTKIKAFMGQLSLEQRAAFIEWVSIGQEDLILLQSATTVDEMVSIVNMTTLPCPHFDRQQKRKTAALYRAQGLQPGEEANF